MNKFKDILQNIDVLTEESKTAISEAFDTAVEQRVDERVQLEVTQALEQLDEQHSTQLDQLLEAIDADHSTKFKKALNHLDEDHTAKLQKVVEHYESQVAGDASALREELTEDISNFLDLYLDKVIPQQDMKLACENTQANKIVESIKQLVGVDERFINDNIKEALKDGKSMIDGLHSKLNESLKENMTLKKGMKDLEAKMLLREKTEDMPQSKKAYVYKLLEAKSPDYIKENFNYVVEMFDREDTGTTQKTVITENTKARKRRSVTRDIDTPKAEEVIQESVSAPENQYLNELKAQERNIKK